jgi:hypothetical protein
MFFPVELDSPRPPRQTTQTGKKVINWAGLGFAKVPCLPVCAKPGMNEKERNEYLLI